MELEKLVAELGDCKRVYGLYPEAFADSALVWDVEGGKLTGKVVVRDPRISDLVPQLPAPTMEEIIRDLWKGTGFAIKFNYDYSGLSLWCTRFVEIRSVLEELQGAGAALRLYLSIRAELCKGELKGAKWPKS